MYKICNTCREKKLLTLFFKEKRNKDGRRPECKACHGIRYKEKDCLRKKDYLHKYGDRIRRYKKNYFTDRYHSDIQFRLSKVLRSRVAMALKKNQKRGSAIRDLGCSISELRLYLENQFQPGMSWDNYGKWHIDHIIPLISFDLTDREQFKKACHFTNLQPLWAEENISKGGIEIP